jgi:hypothetical protein
MRRPYPTSLGECGPNLARCKAMFQELTTGSQSKVLLEYNPFRGQDI